MLLIEGKDTNRRSFFFLVKVTLMTRRFLALSGLGMTSQRFYLARHDRFI